MGRFERFKFPFEFSRFFFFFLKIPLVFLPIYSNTIHYINTNQNK